MTLSKAFRELVRGVTHEDEVAKRLWEKGLLTPKIDATGRYVGDLYCPIARYIFATTRTRIRIGVEAWHGPRDGIRGHLPEILKRFVQAYDNGDYDNLT